MTGEPAVPTLTARAVAIPVPNPEIPVLTGRPVQLVRVPDVGVPNIGVTKVGVPPRVYTPVTVPLKTGAETVGLVLVTTVEPEPVTAFKVVLPKIRAGVVTLVVKLGFAIVLIT
jgi:hypothetical protein